MPPGVRTQPQQRPQMSAARCPWVRRTPRPLWQPEWTLLPPPPPPPPPPPSMAVTLRLSCALRRRPGHQHPALFPMPQPSPVRRSPPPAPPLYKVPILVPPQFRWLWGCRPRVSRRLTWPPRCKASPPSWHLWTHECKNLSLLQLPTHACQFQPQDPPPPPMSDYHSFPTVIPCSTYLQAQRRRSMGLVPLPIRYRGPPVPLPQPQPPYPQASPASPSARGGNWLTFSLHQTAAVPPALTLTSWSLAGKPNVSLTGLNLGTAGPPMTSWHGECPGPTTASTKVRPAKPPGMTRSLSRSSFLDIWGMLPNMTCPQQPRPPCLPISASLCTMPASIPGRVCATTMASYWAWWSKISSHGPIDPSFRNCAYNTPDSPPPHIPTLRTGPDHTPPSMRKLSIGSMSLWRRSCFRAWHLGFSHLCLVS